MMKNDFLQIMYIHKKKKEFRENCFKPVMSLKEKIEIIFCFSFPFPISTNFLLVFPDSFMSLCSLQWASAYDVTLLSFFFSLYILRLLFSRVVDKLDCLLLLYGKYK